MSSGLAGLPDVKESAGSSLDHALWFHRPTRLDEWVLFNLIPTTVSHGRGHYAGTVFNRAGELVAAIAQEALYRFPRGRQLSPNRLDQ